MSENLKMQISQLAFEMKRNPYSTDFKLVHLGGRCLSLFNDSNFGPMIPNYSELMQKLYIETIVDLAHGAPMLHSHSLGLAFVNGKLVRFSVPYSESNSLGTVVCSINLKSRKAFEKHLLENVMPLTQEQINASIYFLVHQLSAFLRL
jgi:hypothetical protein